jgi:hypothetical protein
MRRREELLRVRGDDVPPLVYPLVFGDGDHFPDAARNTQWKLDLKRFAYPYRQFRDTPLYLEFDDAVKNVAEEIAQRLRRLPPWSPDWPTLTPEPEPHVPPSFPRI